MKHFHTIMSVFAGVFCLIYDLWMIQAGHLPAVTMMLALVAWMGLLLGFFARRQRAAHTRHLANNF
ncbi:MAG: hypothetical protein AAF358_09770 [Pseudomonadota bacterium]